MILLIVILVLFVIQDFFFYSIFQNSMCKEVCVFVCVSVYMITL